MRDSASTSEPGVGSAPPDRPVPAPRGTTGMPASRATFMTATTSSVLAGSTTRLGRARKLVSASHS